VTVSTLRLTGSALAVRVQVGEDGRRGVPGSQETRPDEALSLGRPDNLHLGVHGHVVLELALRVRCNKNTQPS
jgi:hypothetical protein